MVLIIGGVLGLGLSLGFFYGFKRTADKVHTIKATKTATTQELADLTAAVAKDLGPGSFRQEAELKGTITCPNPLRAELSNQPCVWYSYTVSREYEETILASDSEGRQVQQIRRGSEVVASNTRSCLFELQDSTGKIWVDPEGAEIQSLKSHSSFQPGDLSSGMRIGNFILNAALGLSAGGRQTLGFRSEEHILPVDKAAFVLGEASDGDGQLKIRKPEKKGALFLISTKSEEEIVKGAMGAETGFLIGSIILGIGGLTALIFGIINILP